MDSHSLTRPLEENASDKDDKSVVSTTSWIFRNDTSTPDYTWYEMKMLRHDYGIYDQDSILYNDDETTFDWTLSSTLPDNNSEAGGEEINHGDEEVHENANDNYDSEDEEDGITGPVLGKRKATDL